MFKKWASRIHYLFTSPVVAIKGFRWLCTHEHVYPRLSSTDERYFECAYCKKDVKI